MASILVICPHALDEVLGCGGTVAAHAAVGDRVEVLVLFGDGAGLDAKRRIAAPQAARILRSEPPRFVGFPENRSDTVPLVEVVGAIERVIAATKPATLYVPHGGNLNVDHQTTCRAAVTAARPVPQHTVRAIYGYEILSSTEWAPPQLENPFLPTRFVDIARTLELKLKALELYAAEMRAPPHARSIEGVRALATHRGHSVGIMAAEAFSVIRELV